MNPNEHNSRRAVRFTFIGVIVVVVGVLFAIYNQEIREHLGLKRDSATGSQPSLAEPSIFDANSGSEISLTDNSENNLERPTPYDPFVNATDLTKEKSHICPVHKVKMQANVIQVEFRFEERWFSEFGKSKNDEFPFAYTFIRGGYVSAIAPPSSRIWFFCGTGLPPATFAKVFVCPQCLATYESAVIAFNPKAVAIRREEEAEAVRRAQPIRRNLK
jgi:hypothetical protein